MKKVVYNACFGGFGLSREAALILVASGFPATARPLAGSGYKDSEFTAEGLMGFRIHRHVHLFLKEGMVYDLRDLRNLHDPNSVALRSHPLLVKVVEILGPRAAGSAARLRVEEVEDGHMYRISSHDGDERVERLVLDGYVQGHIYAEPPELSLPPVHAPAKD